MNPERAARRSSHRAQARRPRSIVAASALAATGLLSTYAVALRPTATYAAQPGRIQPRTACTATATDDTTLRAAVAASSDDSVICIANDIMLSNVVYFNNTTLTFQGVGSTTPVLTVATGRDGIKMDTNGAGDDTLTIDNLAFQAGSAIDSAIEVYGRPSENFNALVIRDSSFADIQSTGGFATAVHSSKARVSITDSIFTGNSGAPSVLVYEGNTVVEGSTFTGNSSTGDGGAVYVEGDATVQGSTFTGNSSTRDGGAVYVGGDATIDGSTFTGNDGRSGGAVYVGGNAGISDSTFTRNEADAFGALGVGADLTSVNTTFIDNVSLDFAGAVYTADQAFLEFSTFVGNSADDYAAAFYAGGAGTVVNTIFVGNTLTGTPDTRYGEEVSIDGATTFAGVSFSDDTSWVGTGVVPTWVDDSFVFATPASMGLDDTVGSWGGPTPTVRLSASSPVASAGVLSPWPGQGTVPAFDQRGVGFPRTEGGTAALGAFQPSTAPSPPSPPAPTPAGPPQQVTATPRDGAATVSWLAPAVSGSFAVSTYKATASPGGAMCLTSARSCVVPGLRNGTTYTFTVEALTGAGWGLTSAPSAPVTPQAPVMPAIVIAGSREADGRSVTVRVSGRLSDLTAPTVRPWVSVNRGEFTEGAAVPVSAERFVWQRRASREVGVYFVADGVKSNTVAIPARER